LCLSGLGLTVRHDIVFEWTEVDCKTGYCV
jgi:hypothetical protein